MHALTRDVGLSALPPAAAGATSLDEVPVSLQHVAPDGVIRLFIDGWVAFAVSLEVGLAPGTIGAVTISCDYVHEVKPGTLEVRTSVARIGSSSFELAQEMHQGGRLVARGRTVLVRKDFEAVRSVPLDGRQREALEAHLLA